MKIYVIDRSGLNDGLAVELAGILQSIEGGLAEIRPNYSCYGAISIAHQKFGQPMSKFLTAYTAFNGSLSADETENRWARASTHNIRTIQDLDNWSDVNSMFYGLIRPCDVVKEWYPGSRVWRSQANAIAVINSDHDRYLISVHFVDCDMETVFCLHQNELVMMAALTAFKVSDLANDQKLLNNVNTALRDSQKWADRYDLQGIYERVQLGVLRRSAADGERQEKLASDALEAEMLAWLKQHDGECADFSEIVVEP